MKKGWLVLLVLLLAAKGAGLLPEGREMEELTLLTELAVDREEGQVTVTALIGGRAAEGEEPRLLTGCGPTLADAVADLEASSLRRTYLGQVEALLVGEGEDLGEALTYVLEHRELKTDITLYIIEGSAGELLGAWATETHGETRPTDDRAMTVGEALAGLTQGRPVQPPVLKLDGRGRVVRGEGEEHQIA